MDEKLVCITGASRGIGLSMVERYLSAGRRVLAISRSDVQISADLDGGRLISVAADIGTAEGRAKVARVSKEEGKIGTLIHNAGKLLYKPFKEVGEEELRSVYEVNVFAPYLFTSELLEQMEACHVINISSIGGVEDSLKFAGLSAYSSSKAALNCLTQMWAEEFKDTEHQFNCLALGSVRTEMFEAAFPGVEASCGPAEMADFVFTFDESARGMINGKIISVSRSNP